MDAGNGRFETAPSLAELFERNPKLKQAFESGQHVFQVGQEIEIKGSRFKVRALGKKFMRLELLTR